MTARFLISYNAQLNSPLFIIQSLSTFQLSYWNNGEYVSNLFQNVLA